MEFINTSDLELVADFVAEEVITKIKSGQQVLWLIPGGSAIAVAAKASLKINKIPHNNLAVTLTDERYGSVGHADSNWFQLSQAGFSLKEARLIPVLAAYNLIETAKVFAANLEIELNKADYAIALFGVGADGHTAGILPHSEAVNSTELVSAYDARNFRRITITPRAIERLDEGIIFAQGESKWPVFRNLKSEISIIDQPVQILKKLKKLTIFTDYKN